MSKDLLTLLILAVLGIVCVSLIIYRHYTDEDDTYKRRQRAIKRAENKGK